ncbi:DEAD/DEAH box helicase [Desulfarculales bacterium]
MTPLGPTRRTRSKTNPPPPPARRRRPPKEEISAKFDPRINQRLLPVLSGIGVPEALPFVPDPFQIEAVQTLASMDVVVSAPTGSGKTWIAEQAIAQALAAGKIAWYASPLKALSNSKFTEFGTIFGEERVGILTGDRKENPQANLIVGTTEILRNQLYDAMYRGVDIDASLVVLDEAHFLGDPERGVVWEEIIIYLPPRVRLLLLSATVENADQITRWLHFVRDEKCATIYSDQRPVPLYPLFLSPDGELLPLTASRGGLFPKVRHFLEQETRNWRPLVHQPPFGQILMALDKADLLPAIFFLKSRADCDAALGYTAGAHLKVRTQQRRELTALVDEFLTRYPFLQSHPQLQALRTLHVAAHHAGHLPLWKLLVERLMQSGLLKAIFSTSTVAAGVNFPARTVVITQSDRFNGRDFVDLSATDLLQMTGRAGRRGMDKVGFVLVVPGPYQNVPLVASLLSSNPEPIESQLTINFSMVLNLLLSQRPSEVKQLLGYSLATFQHLEKADGKCTPTGPQPLLKALGHQLVGSTCPGPEEAVVRRKRRRQLKNLHRRLQQEVQAIIARRGLWAVLTRGRVFMDMFGSLAAVLRREDEGDQAGVLAVSLIPNRRLQKGRPHLEFVPLDEVAGVCSEVLGLPHTGGGRVLAQAVLEQLPQKPRPLTALELDNLGAGERQKTEARLASVDEELARLTCLQCPLYEACQNAKSDLYGLLNQAEAALSRVQEESSAFWYDFVRHLEFLRVEGFADAQGRLTADNRWASNLRLDQPILIAEAIRQEAMPQEDPVLLAALLALFVDDRERESGTRYLSQRLTDGFLSLRRALDPMLERLRQWGFETPIMPMPAASAIFAWGLNNEFSDVAVLYGAGEGDLANLIYRTADNLRQVASLHDTHPKLAACAREAVDLMLRPPVVVPT